MKNRHSKGSGGAFFIRDSHGSANILKEDVGILRRYIIKIATR